ncbi:MAG: hypothetical protein LAQ69_09220 [Acidobacteriia bacterium]|nr:hypothetical protein [Terriglobia bacterium]
MKNNELFTLGDAISGNTARESPTVLIVGPVEDDSGQDSMFGQFPWRTDRVDNCLETILHVHCSLPRVIVCERDLPDGGWKDILEIAASLQSRPPVVVASRQADDYLWAEVLNLGGYDVLRKPLDKGEVSRSVSLAWEHWANQRDSAQRAKRADARKELRVCLTA